LRLERSRLESQSNNNNTSRLERSLQSQSLHFETNNNNNTLRLERTLKSQSLNIKK
jgi:hypothetical protein